MAGLNKVMLIGNAGKDAELRYLSSGFAKSEFSLAVNRRRKNQSGEWEDATDWFNIVILGDQAERVSQYITKGKQVFVEGRLDALALVGPGAPAAECTWSGQSGV